MFQHFFKYPFPLHLQCKNESMSGFIWRHSNSPSDRFLSLHHKWTYFLPSPGPMAIDVQRNCQQHNGPRWSNSPPNVRSEGHMRVLVGWVYDALMVMWPRWPLWGQSPSLREEKWVCGCDWFLPQLQVGGASCSGSWTRLASLAKSAHSPCAHLTQVTLYPPPFMTSINAAQGWIY